MVGDSQSIDSVVDDPFEHYSSAHDTLYRQLFCATNWAAVLSDRNPFSGKVQPLNAKKTVFSISSPHGSLVVKYLPLTKFGHSELHYTRVFSGELGPRLLDVSVLEHGVEMVMEQADMPLSKLLIEDSDHLLALARDLAFLCYELELRGLGHYDLKADNVLCYMQNRDREILRLADFGVTMPIRRFEEHYLGRPIGTPGYIPPEAYRDDPEELDILYTSSETSPCSRADIFAYGALLSQLLQRKNLARDIDPDQLKERMLSGAYRMDLLHFLFSDATPEISEIIYSCTQPDPRARPSSFGDILCILGDP